MTSKYLLILLLFLHGATIASSQELLIKGTITTEKAIPVGGVSVSVKGTSIGIGSNDDGTFSISVPSDTSTLLFSHTSYQDLEIRVDGRNNLNVILVAQDDKMEEVVVVGYGKQKKVNLTGSVATVKMDDALGDRPLASTAQALQGAAPGLQVITNTGRPGQSSSLNIRGYTSINGGSPLVLVDNAEVPSIDDINPKDIESVSILKDASASSIYGARGAFGVILITTKKGSRNDRLLVNYAANLASTRASDLPQKLNTFETAKAFQQWELESTPLIANIDQWVSLLEDFKINPGKYPGDGIYIDATTGNRYPLMDNYNYWDKAFQTGFEQIHNLSISGGSQKSTYRVSLGYTNQDGVLVTNKDSYKRYNLNASLTSDLASNLSTTVNVFYKNDRRKTPGGLSTIFANGVLYPPYAPTGQYLDSATGNAIPFWSPDNFLNLEEPTLDYGDDIRLYGRLQWAPFKNITVASEYTVNRSNSYNDNINVIRTYIDGANFQPIITNAGQSGFNKSNANLLYQSFNATARYEGKWNGGHSFTGLAGYNYEAADSRGFFGQRVDLISEDVPALSTGTGNMFTGDNYYQWAIGGLFGRANYNYQEKYLLELSARYDGSSRFAPDNRFVFVPSGSAGWVITKEKFMQPLKPYLNNLKIFASYGVIGNQNTGSNYYPYLPTMNTYNAEWVDNATNLRYLTIGSPGLVSSGFTWEKVKTLNIGIDFGFFSNKLEGTFEWYRRQTIGMLDAALELPAVLGAKAPLQNVTDLETKGWELNVRWSDKVGELRYSIGGNLFDSRAFITKVKLETGNINNLYAGKELGELWGYTTIGFFKPEDFEQGVPGNFNDPFTLKPGMAPFRNTNPIPGDLRFQDLNGDGVVDNGTSTLTNPGDLKIIGNNLPRYQYGLNGSVGYKNFDLSFFLQGVAKRDRFIYTYLTFPYFSTFTYGIFADQTDVWTATNQDARFPRVASRNYGLAGQNQTRYMFDASYLSIKNITLGYNLPRTLTSRMKLQRMRIFLSGENLYVFDKLPAGVQSDLFIESAGAGYPSLRKFSFGIDVNF